MQTAVSSSLGPRNNLDLIRFGLASMVVLVHAQELSGNGLPFGALLSSRAAVEGFFVISGLLILQSFDRSRTAASYFKKRVRRIYPAYAVVILASAIAGAFITNNDHIRYFGADLLRYVIANLAFLNFLKPDLPGVFAANPLTNAANGALWTLKIEVAFYLSVPIIAWTMRRVAWRLVLLLLYAGSILYSAAAAYLAETTGRGVFGEIGRQLPGQMAFFCVGMAIYRISLQRRVSPVWLLAIGIASYLVSLIGLETLLRPLAIGGVVLAIAYGPWLGNFAKYGDFSYGIYIVHFPILQTLIQYQVLSETPLAQAALGYAISLGVAIGLWHGIEKRFLRSDSHYRREAESSAAPAGTGTANLGITGFDPADLRRGAGRRESP